MKKTLGPIVIALLLLIILVSTALAAPAVSEKEFALKGSFDATETQQFAPPIAYVDAIGVGNALILGCLHTIYRLNFSYLPLRRLHLPH